MMPVKDYKRGEDYVNFRPDRVAMQDATAQNGFAPLMNAGKERWLCPSTAYTVTHLIQLIRAQKRIYYCD